VRLLWRFISTRQVDVMPPEDGSGPGSGPGSAKQLEACMEELENVAGLSSVKEFVKSMRAQLMLDAERRAAGLPTIGQGTLHMVFSGNPVRARARGPLSPPAGVGVGVANPPPYVV